MTPKQAHGQPSSGSLCCTIVLSMLALSGCSSGDDAEAELVLPSEIQADGRTWRKTEISSEDNRVLAGYFRQRPELRDHPNLVGRFVLYVDPQGGKRFYWILASKGGHQWLFLEQNPHSRVIGTKEGAGPPFD